MKNLQKIVLVFALAFCAIAGDSMTSKSKITVAKETIYVVYSSSFSPDMAMKMRKEIEQFYQVKTKTLPPVSLPKKTMTAIEGRYQANRILDWMKEKYRNKNAKVILLTNSDICTDRELNGKVLRNYRIFGLGTQPGNFCVVTISRFGNKKVEKKLAYVVLHELGHNYGLEHCTTLHCMMKDAQGKGANIENEPKQFCKKCRNLLRK
jgi:archaemetzincin